MKIEFSEHARKQFKERKIPKAQVTQTVKTPARKIKSFRNRKLLQKHFGSRILEVVTAIEDAKITVITAYYLKENEN